MWNTLTSFSREEKNQDIVTGVVLVYQHLPALRDKDSEIGNIL